MMRRALRPVVTSSLSAIQRFTSRRCEGAPFVGLVHKLVGVPRWKLDHGDADLLTQTGASQRRDRAYSWTRRRSLANVTIDNEEDLGRTRSRWKRCGRGS